MIRFTNYKCLSFSNSTLVLRKQTDIAHVYGPVYTFYDKDSNKWKIDVEIFRRNEGSMFFSEIITWFDIERRKSLQLCYRRKLYFLSKESLKSFLEITEKDVFVDSQSHVQVPKEKRTIIYK